MSLGFDAGPYEKNKSRTIAVDVTAAANDGSDTTLATVVNQPCIITNVVILANSAQTGDLTSCPTFAGAAKVVILNPVAEAIQANLDAEDKQLWWSGYVALKSGKTIVMEHNGTGATALDLTVYITYYPTENGGYLV